jgi:hypothetical protein
VAQRQDGSFLSLLREGEVMLAMKCDSTEWNYKTFALSA